MPINAMAGGNLGVVFAASSQGIYHNTSTNTDTLVNGGVYLSGNDGRTWTYVSDSMGAFINVTMLAADNNGVLYAVVVSDTFGVGGNFISNNSELFRSTDNGNHWKVIYTAVEGSDTSITSIVLNNSGGIFFGTASHGVYRSTNAGGSWTFLSYLGPISIATLGVDPNGDIFADAASNGSGELFRSQNNGNTWTIGGSGLGNDVVTTFARNANDFFAGTIKGVYLSIDNGATWTFLHNNATSPAAVSSLAVDSQGNIFAGTNTGVFFSRDNGTSWAETNSGLTQAVLAPSVHALVINSNDYLFAGLDSGVYRSVYQTESGTSFRNFWEYLNGPVDYLGNPLQATSILFAHGGYLLAGTASSGVYRSDNNGASWYAVNNDAFGSGTMPWINTMAVVPDGDVFAGTGFIFAGNSNFRQGIGVCRSTDNGYSWTIVDDFGGQNATNALVVDTGDVFAATLNAVYRSQDDGALWSTASAGLPQGISGGVYAMTVDQNNNVYAGTNSGVYLSADEGNSWVGINYGLGSQIVSLLTADTLGNIYAGILDGGLMQSQNHGLSWWRNWAYPSDTLSAIAASPGGIIFAATGTVNYRSMDNGGHWQEIDNGLPDSSRYISQFTFGSDGHVYAATQYGVYRSIHQIGSDSGLTVGVQELRQPVSAALNILAYPNPVQSQTTLQYAISQSSPVTLTVSNILGETVATLLHGAQQSAGMYQMPYATGDLPQGVYFCTLRAGSLTKTTKLFVTK